MKLLFLGVGGWVSRPGLGYTSILVKSSSGVSLLLDAGEGVTRSLYEHGYRVSDLDAVVVSHMHGDHVLGLPTLIMIKKYYEQSSSKLDVFIHRDLVGDLETLLKITGVKYDNLVEIHGVKPGDVVEVGDLKIEFEEAVHTSLSLMTKVTSRDKCIVYTGDTSYNPRLSQFASGCSVLIHEASGYNPEAHIHGHSTVLDAFKSALEAGVEKLVIIHYYMDITSLKEITLRDLEVYLAIPGLEIEV